MSRFLLFFILLATSILPGSSDCYYCFVVRGGERQHYDSSFCNASRVVQEFGDLQTALLMIAGLETNSLPLQDDGSSDCVYVGVLGYHVITAPVDFGTASVEFMGLQEATGSPPTIHCNYTVNVDPERIFDPDYSYVDYTVSFFRSERVSINGVRFISCPYPLKLEEVRDIVILDNTFQ